MRIVCDYGDTPRMSLLARIETETGMEMPTWYATEWTGDVAQFYPSATLDNLHVFEGPNAEGFVLHWLEHNLRVKVKFAEYLRLHKLLTGVTTRSIWEMLRDGRPTEALYENVPDEFHGWVSNEVEALCTAYHNNLSKALDSYDRVRFLPTRADQARAIASDPYRSVVFAILDDKPVKRLIWDMVKPEKSRPFWGVTQLAEAA